mmetsp:Transcript_1954/g.2139  ORF Transcript_1954/g.2139 Transcript_1954/m.2139 type:complete len:100 (+) Transcript_1954:327-626(+)
MMSNGNAVNTMHNAPILASNNSHRALASTSTITSTITTTQRNKNMLVEAAESQTKASASASAAEALSLADTISRRFTEPIDTLIFQQVTPTGVLCASVN